MPRRAISTSRLKHMRYEGNADHYELVRETYAQITTLLEYGRVSARVRRHALEIALEDTYTDPWDIAPPTRAIARLAALEVALRMVN